MNICRLWTLPAALLACGWIAEATAVPVPAHGARDDVPRIAVVSAFAPELTILKHDLVDAAAHRVNGVEFTTGRLEGRDVVLFLSGISMVNAAMTAQLALDHFAIDRIVFSGIAGGVAPELDIGDVVVADRWGQYLETVFARETEHGVEEASLLRISSSGISE